MRFPSIQVACVTGGFVVGYLLSSTAGRFSDAQTSPAFKARWGADAISDEISQRKLSALEIVALCERRGGSRLFHDLYAALQKWEAEDFQAAVADLPSLTQSFQQLSLELRYPLLEAAMDRWLAVDQQGALQWLSSAPELNAFWASNPGGGARGAAQNQWLAPTALSLFRPLARRDATWLRNRINQIPPGTVQRRAIRALIEETVQTDPQQAQALLSEFASREARMSAFGGMVDGLAKSDPAAAMEAALAAKPDEGRDTLLRAAISAAAEEGPAIAHEALERIRDAGLRQKMTWSAAAELARSTSSDVFGFLDRHLLPEMGGAYPEEAYTVINLLASEEPGRAAKWAENLEGSQRAQVVGTVLSTWQNSDPKGALGWLTSLPTEKVPVDSDRWIHTLTEFAKSVPKEIETWSSTLPEGRLRDQVRATLATRYANEGNFQEAIRIAQASSFPTFAAANLAGSIAREDPALAVDWLSKLESGPMQNEVARGVASTWTDRNPKEVAAWIQQMPAGGARDAATTAMTAVVSYSDPVSASEWVERISDPVARLRAAQNVYNLWAREDPNPASRWMLKLGGVDDHRRNLFVRSWGQ